MKQMNTKPWMLVVVCSTLLLSLFSCSQQRKDEEIKADLTVKAKEDKRFTVVHFVVDGGIVSLSGECPTTTARTKVKTTVKGVYAVKGVLNNSIIGQVVIGIGERLRQSVDSVLGKYPGMQAIVKDSAVQLLGKAGNKDKQKLLAAIQTLQPKQLQNEVMFK